MGKPKYETKPPQPVTCPQCGSDRTVFQYSRHYRESGFRRVFVSCQQCRSVLFYDQETAIPREKSDAIADGTKKVQPSTTTGE